MVAEKVARNVGTPGNPVSWLHQRAVALLYDELNREKYDGREVVARLAPDGEFSHDLKAGVDSVHVPGEWDNVGSLVPDLICKDAKGQPVRIIEVIVTNPPSNAKRQKLENLKKRGVDVVEITVQSESDLLKLCWVPARSDFRSIDIRTVRSTSMNQRAMLKTERPHNERVSQLINDLRWCSPDVRREFIDVCSQLKSLESLYPVRPDNPLQEALSQPHHDET